MEFFAEVTDKNISPEELYELLAIPQLPVFSESLDKVLSLDSDTAGEIYSIWGQFGVTRQQIRNGVRFALTNCPHAFTWTVCVHESSQTIMIHCTIDKKDEDEEFVESIENFVSEWQHALTEQLK